MSIIVSNRQHCDEQQFQNTVMCTLHDLHSNKVRFIYTSTVTGLDSCYIKKNEHFYNFWGTKLQQNIIQKRTKLRNF